MFDVSGFGSSIHINSITGTQLWRYTAADTSGWPTLDTAGIDGWTPLYNSDTSWIFGAFDKGMVFSNPNDLGWGVYNSITHIVTGDSLYVIKLASGAYKKLWIQSLASGNYNFKYANIDGSSQQSGTIVKSAYSGKNFAYFSLQSNMALDREPASANWDLLFTQYTAFIPSPYTVAGVLLNVGVTAAQANGIPNTTTYDSWEAHTFTPPVNEIGYDWKAFSGSWVIEDSLVYFVKPASGDIWKLIFTGFGGSANGNYIFSKELLSPVSVSEVHAGLTVLSVYPNPVENSYATVVYDNAANEQPELTVNDMNGKIVFETALPNTPGIQKITLNTAGYDAGVYILSIRSKTQLTQQKLIVR